MKEFYQDCGYYSSRDFFNRGKIFLKNGSNGCVNDNSRKNVLYKMHDYSTCIFYSAFKFIISMNDRSSRRFSRYQNTGTELNFDELGQTQIQAL